MKREFNPNITDPDISLPETAKPAESVPGNPLEELVDLDQKIARVNKFLMGRTITYAGRRIKVEKLDFDLSIIGKDGDGVSIVVPKNDFRSCEIVDEEPL